MPGWPGRSRAEVIPEVTGTVGGDLFVVGKLAITKTETSQREFRLVPFDSGGPPLPSRDDARARPGYLLDARLGLVGFTRRGMELAWLQAWRESRGHPKASAYLVHGEGGSGKTRLARHFCQLSVQAGWNVWQAEYDPAGSVARLPERLATDGAAGTLVLIDYAERWPMAQLLALLTHPLLTAVAPPVRVLLLARPAGTWWAVLSYRLGRLGITAEAHELAPLAGRRAIPALYAHARDRFAELLDVPGCEAIQPPDLSSEDYELVLAVHMAALVAVDARLRGHEVPAEPARLSAYLLDRERAAWRTRKSAAPLRRHGARPRGLPSRADRPAALS